MQQERNERHEKLIDFLSGFSQYQAHDGKPLIKKVKKERSSIDVQKISVHDINYAVVAFIDFLNIGGGSIADIDLYRLLQAYLTIPEYRGKINLLVNEAHSFAHNKKKGK